VRKKRIVNEVWPGGGFQVRKKRIVNEVWPGGGFQVRKKRIVNEDLVFGILVRTWRRTSGEKKENSERRSSVRNISEDPEEDSDFRREKRE
jgi:hypothetical protein